MKNNINKKFRKKKKDNKHKKDSDIIKIKKPYNSNKQQWYDDMDIDVDEMVK